MADKEAVKLLKEIPLFSELNDKELKAVLVTTKERDFPAGKMIVKEGDVGNVGFYLIKKGSVDVQKGGAHLRKLEVGGFFGEMALLDELPRSADVIAAEDTTCLMLTRWDLRALIGTHPDIALKMMHEITKRLRETNHALSE